LQPQILPAAEPPTVTTAAPPRSRVDPERIDPATARAEAARILEAVARARERSVTREVTVDVIDKAGIREFAKASLYEFTTPDELAMHGRIEASLGVVPPGSDPEAVILDLLEQGVLGLYDPKRKTLFIGDFVPSSALSMVVGHEIAHGLQDMVFDLHALQKPLLHRSDEESARRFLVEGEAQAAYLAWISGERGLAALEDTVLRAMGDQALQLAGVASPYPVLARSLQMPYADGAATVVRLAQRKGWTAVDDLYRRLPESTEQMLHLDKLLARELPVAVRLDARALEPVVRAAGLVQVWHDGLGEAALLSMLAERHGAAQAREAAAGWGGDHYLAYEPPDAPRSRPSMVVAATVWDSAADAKQFVDAFTPYLAEHAAAGHVIDRRGNRVVFATGIPEAIDVAALRKALWRGTQLGRAVSQAEAAEASTR
jgi:hypothetical protein